MKIVFFLSLLVCGSGYITNKDRLAKSDLELNRSVVTAQRKFGSSKAMSLMKALLKNESAKFQQVLVDSKMYDICEHLYKTTRTDEYGNQLEITSSTTTSTNHPKNFVGNAIRAILGESNWQDLDFFFRKKLKIGRMWQFIEVFYWVAMFGTAIWTIHLMTQVAIKDVEGSSSTYTPLHMECYPKLRDALIFFKDTTLADYEDPCTLASVNDCDDEGLELSPVRQFSRCVMDNMNAVVEYQRDAIILLTYISKTHALFDQIATHLAIDSSSDKIKAELEMDAEEDEDQEFDSVRKICSIQSRFEKLAASVEGHFDNIIKDSRAL